MTASERERRGGEGREIVERAIQNDEDKRDFTFTCCRKFVW